MQNNNLAPELIENEDQYLAALAIEFLNSLSPEERAAQIIPENIKRLIATH